MKNQPKRAERDISEKGTMFMNDADYILYIRELVKLEKAGKKHESYDSNP